ncbi:MAG TPA: aldo/keto reductase [Methylocella sp.]|nr:aldo/keto reductase [Methylocella sp.]
MVEATNYAEAGISKLGLGCSRVGSILTKGGDPPQALLLAAYEAGVRFFDTADIYGQGDSERVIGGTVARRKDVRICTKVGMRFPLKMRILMPLKEPLKRLVAASPALASKVRAARGDTLPTCFEPAYLRRAIERSLKRLGVDHVDMLMLHGSTAEEIRQGDALDALGCFAREGKFRVLGVSCEDLHTAEVALGNPKVRAIQIPFVYGDTRARDIAARAKAANIEVIARQILSGSGVTTASDPETRCDALARVFRSVIGCPDVAFALLGTTSRSHFFEAVAALNATEPSVEGR